MYEANRKFNDPEQLKKDIDNFFIECKKEKIIPTVTGLAVALDTTRETLLQYENLIVKKLPDDVKKEISDTIRKAKQKIQAGYEQHLLTGNRPVGAIFTLKNNFGWVDKQEVIQTVENKTPDLSGLTVDELKSLMESK